MTSIELAGRRDRKKTQTRQALRSAALRLVQELGYEHVTVEAITEAADVSLRTFFNYFASKDDALLAPDPERADEFARAMAERPAGEPIVESLRAAFASVADTFGASEDVWAARAAVVRANPTLWPRMVAGFTEFERRLTEAVADRTGSDPAEDLYPGVVAAAVVGALRVAVAHWRAGGDRVALGRLLDKAFDILSAGLAAPTPSTKHGGES